MANFSIFAVLVAVFGVTHVYTDWPPRTMNCSRVGDENRCFLNGRDARKYACFEDELRDDMWAVSKLGRKYPSKIVVCPLNCEEAASLSVTQKHPQRKKCAYHFTHGNYWDERKGDYFMWIRHPCHSNLTVQCHINGVGRT